MAMTGFKVWVAIAVPGILDMRAVGLFKELQSRYLQLKWLLYNLKKSLRIILNAVLLIK